ncbi:3147_t:CDS:2, partial [Scutellospora calospora]
SMLLNADPPEGPLVGDIPQEYHKLFCYDYNLREEKYFLGVK